MDGFVKGDVIVLPFPFSDLSNAKRRPALVVAVLTGVDVILCQITSQTFADHYAIPLLETDFVDEKLTRDSNIRPNRLFTADTNIILYRVGAIKPEKMQTVVDKIIEIVSS